MKKIKLFLLTAGLVTSAVCTTAQTNVNPHPFTTHDVGDGDRQVVYFSTDEPTRQQWSENYEENKQILSKSEWDCLLNERVFKGIAAANFRGWAQLFDEDSDTKVKNAYAVLLPDDWAEMYHFDNTTSAWYKDNEHKEKLFNIGSAFSSNALHEADMAALQQAGAVFLPCEIIESDGVHAEGQYWTSTKEDGKGIYYAYFSTSSTDSPEPIVKINENGDASEERYVLKAIREVTITMDENEDNTDLLNIWKTHQQPVNVQLGRSLTPGMYNTFCLPFGLNAKEVKDVFGETTKLAKFTIGTLSDDKTTLNIEFEDIDLSIDNAPAIEAGTPYLIQPTNAVASPIFYNRIIKYTSASGETFSSADKIEYLGIINPHQLEAGNKQHLFLQANNTLTWSKEGDTSTMKGMRGYFYVPDMQAKCPARLSVRPAPQTPTASEVVRGAQCTMHSEKYIYNNRVVIIRNGEMRDIFGNIIK